MKKIVEKSIIEIVNDYERNEKKYTTEGDIVCNLFTNLLSVYDENIIVHSQVRPFSGEIEKEKVIIDGEWREPKGGKANSGSVIDLAIIDMSKDYWNKTIRKANRDQLGEEKEDKGSLNYWRILSYPVEAFHVAIEVKAKVKGNKGRIKEDIDKLAKIKERNPKCLTYMIILDRQASPDRVQKFIESVENTQRIDGVFTYPVIK